MRVAFDIEHKAPGSKGSNTSPASAGSNGSGMPGFTSSGLYPRTSTIIPTATNPMRLHSIEQDSKDEIHGRDGAAHINGLQMSSAAPSNKRPSPPTKKSFSQNTRGEVITSEYLPSTATREREKVAIASAVSELPSPATAAMQALGIKAGSSNIIGDITEPFWVQDTTMGGDPLWCDPDEVFLENAKAYITAEDKRKFWEMSRSIIELPQLSDICSGSCIRNSEDLTAILKRPEFRILWLSDAPQYLPKDVASELIRCAYCTTGTRD